jgi:hypothetical protein
MEQKKKYLALPGIELGRPARRYADFAIPAPMLMGVETNFQNS